MRNVHMKKNRIAKRIVTLFLVFAVAVACAPAMAFAGADAPEKAEEGITVYFTLSDDSDFVKGIDRDETVLARVPVRISYTSLGIYGLEEFNRLEADSFEEGGKYKNSVIVEQPTLLMLYLKALGMYYLGHEFSKSDLNTDALTITGSPTSLYMAKFWGHDENLMYFVNHEYPLMAKGWGATSDYILLNDGDEIDVAMFTDWNFYHYGAFATFSNNNPKLSAGSSVTLKMTSSGTSAGLNGETVNAGAVMAHEPIRISSDYGRTWEQTEYVTDDKGAFTAKFEDPGVYYLSGGPDFRYQEDQGADSACVAPPVSVVEVSPGQVTGLRCESTTDQSVELKWDAVKGADGYFVKYKKSDDSKWKSVDADSAGREISGLDSRAEYSFKVSAYVDDRYVPTGEEAKKLEGKDSVAVISSTPASELDLYKDALRLALKKYRDTSLYKPEQQTALAKAIGEGETAIDKATDKDSADSALAKAQREIGKIKTISQLLADRKKSAQEEAINYYRDNENKLDASKGASLLLNGLGEISGAETEEAVDASLANLKEEIDKLKQAKLDSDAEAEKALKSAQEDAAKQLEEKVAAVPEGELRNEISLIAKNAETKINEAASVEAVAEIAASALGDIEETVVRAEEAAKNKAALEALTKEKEAAERKAAEYAAKLEKAARKEAEGLRVTGLKASVKSWKGILSWKRNSKADGYQVQYKKKGGKYATLKVTKNNTTLTAKTKTLKKGKKYYFRIRCCTVIDGKKVFGKWSDTKSVRCR